MWMSLTAIPCRLVSVSSTDIMSQIMSAALKRISLTSFSISKAIAAEPSIIVRCMLNVMFSSSRRGCTSC